MWPRLKVGKYAFLALDMFRFEEDNDLDSEANPFAEEYNTFNGLHLRMRSGRSHIHLGRGSASNIAIEPIIR